MKDLDFVLELIDPWISKFISEGSAALSPIELVGVGIWTLEAEVNNGGFDQYYFNSAGELAIQTVSSLEAIGAPNTASLLAAANSEFPSATPPADRRLRQEMLEKIRDVARFGALEQEFYRDEEHLVSRLASYLKGNAVDD